MDATNVIDINSDLVRKGWVKEGLIQKRSQSFWSPYVGNSGESVIYQKNMTSAAEGNTIIFDYKGNIATYASVDKEQATGTGEAKMKFSNSLTIRRLRKVVDNGDKFDAKVVNDLASAEHGDAMSILADNWTRDKDQYFFDCAQGFHNGVAPTHKIDVAYGGLTYNKLLEIEEMMKAGDGFSTGGRRRPLRPFKTQDGRDVWAYVLGSKAKLSLMKDTDFQHLLAQGDVRGSGNLLFKGVLGQIGQLVILEAPTFFGVSKGNGLGKSKVEISGLRYIDAGGHFQGESNFTTAETERGFLMGAGAFQFGMGKEPDYKYQESNDFGITSESMLETWVGFQKTQLVAEDEDYASAKIASMDYGIIAVDYDVTP